MAARDPDDFVREVARRVAAARRAAGLTQEAAAQRYGTALKNWQRFEAGQNITLHTLARIAATLGATPEDLVNRDRRGLPTAVAAGKESTTRARAGRKDRTKGTRTRPKAASPKRERSAKKKEVTGKGSRLAAN